VGKLRIEEKCRVLAKVPLLSGLSEKDLEAIATVSTTRLLKAREELFHKGDEGTQLYVVASGQLKVITTSDEGDDLIFCVIGPGEVVGEIALLIDRCRTATVTGMERSELIVIQRDDFRGLLRTRPEVGIELLTVLATRLARVSEFLEDTQFLKLPARLAKKIVALANHHGRLSSGEKGDELLIDLKLSQGEWGDLVGTTRESINKQFGAWKKEGVIRIDDGRLTLTDIDEIEKLANCVML